MELNIDETRAGLRFPAAWAPRLLFVKKETQSQTKKNRFDYV